MHKNFYLIGAGDYGKQLKIFLKKNKIYNSVLFVDDKLDLKVNKFLKITNKVFFNITISKPHIRQNIYKKLIKKNFFYQTLILPNKNIYSNKIGNGCVLEPNILVANDVLLGIGNFIFYGSSIAHKVNVGNFCNIGCNVVISGNTKIGNKVIIGANTFISNNLDICDNVTITPGSVILKSIKKPGIYQNNIIIKSI